MQLKVQQNGALARAKAIAAKVSSMQLPVQPACKRGDKGVQLLTSENKQKVALAVRGLLVTEADILQHVEPDRWLPDKELRALAVGVHFIKQLRVGIVPDHYLATTTCRGCGPVPIFEGSPEEVDICPWCTNRVMGLDMPDLG